MKKILLIMLLVSSTAFACDGSCRCGGAKPVSGLPIIVKTAAVFFVAKVTGPFIVVPLVAIELSRGQAAYNKAHGITHDRKNRK